MRNATTYLAIIACLLLTTQALSAETLAEGAPPDGPGLSEPALLRIGTTGINCVTTPCPWRGILPVDETGHTAGPVLWSGTDLPPVTGPGDIAARVGRAWANDTCLIVTGRVMPETVEISEIVKECQ